MFCTVNHSGTRLCPILAQSLLDEQAKSPSALICDQRPRHHHEIITRIGGSTDSTGSPVIMTSHTHTHTHTGATGVGMILTPRHQRTVERRTTNHIVSD